MLSFSVTQSIGLVFSLRWFGRTAHRTLRKFVIICMLIESVAPVAEGVGLVLVVEEQISKVWISEEIR
jgi:hypothetical protein